MEQNQLVKHMQEELDYHALEYLYETEEDQPAKAAEFKIRAGSYNALLRGMHGSHPEKTFTTQVQRYLVQRKAEGEEFGERVAQRIEKLEKDGWV